MIRRARAPRVWTLWAPVVSLAALTVYWVARWPTFPLVLDPYYHLLIAQQVRDAGGLIAYEWWEYAPVGRPHLYPPLLHLLLAILLKVGSSPLTAIRVASAALLPALLLTLWLVMRRLAGPAIALGCLWMGMIPFSFHLHSAITMAATLGMIELLWLLDALAHRRTMAAGLLLTLLFYTHLGLPWISLVALGAYGLFQPSARRQAARVCWGALPAIPWLAHLWRHRTGFHPFPRFENTMLDLSPFLYLAALVGVWRCWQLKGRLLWLPACWLGFTLLVPGHRYRWLSGEGMLPVILLAGVGAEWCARWLATPQVLLRSAKQNQAPRVYPGAGFRPAQRWVRAPRACPRGSTRVNRRFHMAKLTGLALILIVAVLSPSLEQTETGWRWRWPDSAPLHLIGAPAMVDKPIESSLYTPQIERLVRVVATQTQPGEILWSNAPYAIGLIAALAHRPISSAMLSEVPAARPFDPIGVAHLIVWFKLEEQPQIAAALRLRGYPVSLVAEDELAMVYRQSGAAQHAIRPTAVLPLWLAFALVSVAVGLITLDLSRP